MNDLMSKLKTTFQQKQTSIAEQYWAMLGDSNTDPEALLELAGGLGKDLEAINQDMALLGEIKSQKLPDAKKVESEIKKTLDKSWRMAAEAAKLADEVQIKRHDAEALRAKANTLRVNLDAQQRGYKALVNRLAQAGHPDYQQQVIELDAARQADRQAKAKAAEIKRLEGLLDQERQSLEGFKARIGDRQSADAERGIADREQAVRELEENLASLG